MVCKDWTLRGAFIDLAYYVLDLNPIVWWIGTLILVYGLIMEFKGCVRNE